MIIGIDASRANLQHKTGTEWYSFYLIKNLAEIDRTNKYWLYLNEPPRSELIEAVKSNPNFSFKFLKWPLYAFWTLGRLTLEMLYCRPDILFVPAHALPLFGPLKTVNTIHDIAFSREQSLYRPTKVKTYTRFSQKLIKFFVPFLTAGRYHYQSIDYLRWSTAFALRHAKKIIVVSDFTKQEILDVYPKTNQMKIEVVYNGYPEDLYHLINEPVKIKNILDKYGLEAPFFLYVGRLEKKKNIPLLVEAFSIFKENNPDNRTKLILIGDAGFGYDEVKYLIQEYNLENEVIMPGWVSETDLPYIFNAARAFIFPSKHEGFGIPVLQAMACGVPTAISDIPVLREVATDASLFFNPNDKYSIANSLIEIDKNEELRNRLKTNGLERVKNFSWRKCAIETLKIFENL